MPIYEYELNDDEPECQICPGRFEVLQSKNEPPIERCPGCGLPCRRVVSGASFRISKGLTPQRAAELGFTTWRRARKGEWEKVAGQGVDAIVSSEDDRRAVEEERRRKRKLDL